MNRPQQTLKVIRFEGEMLPGWAQLLDAAAQFCLVSEQTRRWFSRFANSSGVDDARAVVAEARILKLALRESRERLLTELERARGDGQAVLILAAWNYALDTMIQEADGKKTCSWKIEGAAETNENEDGDGDITLRRV